MSSRPSFRPFSVSDGSPDHSPDRPITVCPTGALFFLCLGRDPYDIPVAVFNGELEPRYSQDFLLLIDNRTISQTLFGSFDSAFDSVKNGENKALIAIGANFTEAVMERGLQGYEADKETIEMSSIKLYLDMTSQSRDLTSRV